MTKRPDGKRVQGVDPFDRMLPMILRKRYDAQNYIAYELPCEGMDAFIAQKRAEGKRYTYMQLVMAAGVRLLALRPKMNRFIMNGSIYAHNDISIAVSIKRTLRRDDEAETTVKLIFNGLETLDEICQIIDNAVKGVTQAKEETQTDQVAEVLTKVPDWLLRPVVSTLMFLDRHNRMPKAVIDASPWHSSVFFPNIKSLGLPHISHHLSDFGTAGLFFAMGKEYKKMIPTGENTFKTKKVLPFGLVMDERICDGLYLARSVQLLKKLVSHPELLETPPEQRLFDNF